MTSLLLVTLLLAADPQATITGDKTTLAGIPAKITASTSTNVKKVIWLVNPEPIYVEKFNDGLDLRLGHDEPITVYVTMIATSPDGGADIASWTLQVVAKAKATTPPAITPQASTLQPSSMLAKRVAKELAKMQEVQPLAEFDAVGLLDEVTSADLKGEASKVANCLLQECRFLEGLPGGTPNTENIVKSIAIICKGSMTAVQWQGWSPWFAELGLYLDDLGADGQLETLADYSEVLHEVAAELKDFCTGDTE